MVYRTWVVAVSTFSDVDGRRPSVLPAKWPSSTLSHTEVNMNHLPTTPLFPAGQIVATPGALALLDRTNKTPIEFLSRHLRGDWGDLCLEDKTENELSLKHGFRLMSSYQVTENENLWVITEADRTITTILLPSEY